MADYSFLAGLGSGLSELGNQLTRREMLKLAQEEKDLAAKRQAEQDALARAQAVGAEARGLRSENFEFGVKKGDNSPQAWNALLRNAGQFQSPYQEKQRGEEYTAPVSGDVYFRDPGMAPNAIRAEQAAQALSVKQELAKIAADNRTELERMRSENRTNIAGMTDSRVRELFPQVSGNVKYRVDNPSPSGGSSRDGSMDKRSSSILSLAQKLATPRFNRETMEDEPGLEWGEAVAKATQVVDAATGKATSPGAGASSAVSEQALMTRAQQKIAEIQSDASLDAGTKASMIQQVNQLLAAKVQALRSGR